MVAILRAKAAYNQAYQLGCAEAITRIRQAEAKYNAAAYR